eukprot:Plantae.Rhodophyta-Purpureofilum_apyrenoidigerum.ctg14321.p1 GENE.Plantae.Rhodophyta-Purpureofilum_apyrenoidigerum.ctg14321~~Plantae.Rhodophyta-Purpureofilum_apyrenoidigerum.ctg14321.p1  ORF type:complete len:153 (+),score=24.99 Plantae.Rhodophyta-Purpureofilum_apyrenoidigerum.ctg14321:452-910(+)
MFGFIPSLPVGSHRRAFRRAPRVRSHFADEIGDLCDVVNQLGLGCAWLADQTPATIASHIREEIAEVQECLESGTTTEEVEEELGDVMFNVLLLAKVLCRESGGSFQFGRGIRATAEKVVRRSPHVFGNETALTAQDAMALWQREKKKEKEN